MTDDVLAEMRSGAMWVTLNRPDALNAITPAVVDGINAAFDRAASEGAHERLRQVHTVAYDLAPAIRDIFDRAGLVPADLKTVQDLSRLPVFKKERWSINSPCSTRSGSSPW